MAVMDCGGGDRAAAGGLERVAATRVRLAARRGQGWSWSSADQWHPAEVGVRIADARNRSNLAYMAAHGGGGGDHGRRSGRRVAPFPKRAGSKRYFPYGLMCSYLAGERWATSASVNAWPPARSCSRTAAM